MAATVEVCTRRLKNFLIIFKFEKLLYLLLPAAVQGHPGGSRGRCRASGVGRSLAGVVAWDPKNIHLKINIIFH